jgi:hypothetical protein
MKDCLETDIDREIAQQLYLAAEKLNLGARTVPLDELYDELEMMGAHPFLLGIAGSWGDTLDDDEVLDMLREWNATGTLDFESFID